MYDCFYLLDTKIFYLYIKGCFGFYLSVPLIKSVKFFCSFFRSQKSMQSIKSDPSELTNMLQSICLNEFDYTKKLSTVVECVDKSNLSDVLKDVGLIKFLNFILDSGNTVMVDLLLQEHYITKSDLENLFELSLAEIDLNKFKTLLNYMSQHLINQILKKAARQDKRSFIHLCHRKRFSIDYLGLIDTAKQCSNHLLYTELLLMLHGDICRNI